MRLSEPSGKPPKFAQRVRPSTPGGCGGLRVRRLLVAAMEQQMWFFGCDAACADGNLLVRYGFRRYRQEVQPGESSSYRFLWRPPAARDTPPAQVDLHGWCAGLHPLGGSRMEGGFLYVRAAQPHRLVRRARAARAWRVRRPGCSPGISRLGTSPRGRVLPRGGTLS